MLSCKYAWKMRRFQGRQDIFNNHGHSFQLNTLALQPLKAAPAGSLRRASLHLNDTMAIILAVRTHYESESRLRRDSTRDKNTEGGNLPGQLCEPQITPVKKFHGL